MKKTLFILAAAAMLVPASGCVSILYSHEVDRPGEIRREAGLLGVTLGAGDTQMFHGLIPLYIDTRLKPISAPAQDAM